MKPTLLLIIIAAIAIGSSAQSPGFEKHLVSANAQERVDAFYEVFDSDDRLSGWQAELILGKTPEQICDLLGKPVGVNVLEDGKDTWLHAQYLFKEIPTTAPNREELVKKKWKYGPSVVFRNGVSVQPRILWDKLFADHGGVMRQVEPPDPRWRKFDRFPCQ